MKNKWLKIILAASLALNLAFVSTTLYRKFTAPGKKPVNQLTFDQDFKLRSEQKKQVKIIIKQFKMNLFKYKQEILDKRIAIIEAMGDTDFNPEDIEKKTGGLNELENQLNLLFVETLIQINNLLEPEQRLTFLYKLSQNWFFIDKGRNDSKSKR